MVQRYLPRSTVADDVLVPVLDRIRSELRIPRSFPADVAAQASRAVDQWRAFVAATRIPDPVPALDADQDADDIQALYPFRVPTDPSWDALWTPALPGLDGTHIPFVTIDPPGSRDLDQAMHLLRLPPGEPDGAAYLVTYAIASMATFVPPGSPLDVEVRARGLTTYFPDAATPLHPPGLSEGAASLLPGQKCPACVWHIRLGPDGRRLSWRARRAVVISRAQLTYDQVQEAIARSDLGLPLIDEDGAPVLPPGVPGDLPTLLREIGVLRLEREADRGGVSARIPEQEVIRIDEAGESRRFRLVYRSNLPSEEWNAQISLLTGMCAASVMREVGTGILRTVPPASPSSIARLRVVARALDVDWPEAEPYPDLVRRLDPATSRNAAFLLEATSLFRGAGYAVFGVAGHPVFPPLGAVETRHEAIAAEYAHATAPLRRLVDRWSEEICLAVCAGEAVPGWVVESVGEVPSLMGLAGQRVAAADRESLAAIGALLLEDEVGETFSGAVVDVDRRANGGGGTRAGGGTGPNGGGARSDSGVPAGSGGPSNGRARAVTARGTVMIADPAVMARVTPEDPAMVLPLGEVVDVRLGTADVERRRIEFIWPADEALYHNGQATG